MPGEKGSPAEIRTRGTSFKGWCDNHYTTGEKSHHYRAAKFLYHEQVTTLLWVSFGSDSISCDKAQSVYRPLNSHCGCISPNLSRWKFSHSVGGTAGVSLHAICFTRTGRSRKFLLSTTYPNSSSLRPSAFGHSLLSKPCRIGDSVRTFSTKESKQAPLSLISL